MEWSQQVALDYHQIDGTYLELELEFRWDIDKIPENCYGNYNIAHKHAEEKPTILTLNTHYVKEG